jgi:cell wall-associated NlpC family hydrolase
MNKVYMLVFTLSVMFVSAEAKIKTANYTIKKGDTLYSLARVYHMTVKDIKMLNHMSAHDVLKVGNRFKVPKDNFPNLDIFSDKANKEKRLAQKTKATKIVKKKVIKKTKWVKKKVKRKKLAKKKHSSKKLVASLAKLESVTIKKGSVITHKNKTSFSISDFLYSRNSKSTKITSLAKTKLGRRYVWGATGSKNTFDCSGFTKYVYQKNGINIPRTSRNQSKFGKFVSRNNLKKGDLIFFDTSKRRKGYVNHVGIYLGNGKFIHASSAKKKVVVSNLSKFYAQRYKGARRPS